MSSCIKEIGFILNIASNPGFFITQSLWTLGFMGYRKITSIQQENERRNLPQAVVDIMQLDGSIKEQIPRVESAIGRVESVITQGNQGIHQAVEEMAVANNSLNNSTEVLNQSSARLGDALPPLQAVAERTSNAINRLGEITTLREENQRLLQELGASREMNRTFHAAIQRFEQQIDQQNTEIAHLRQIITQMR